ncbi:MAG: hypothetical protein SFV21_14100 [Rhodospirillaceae bacterium]|nr:hypothetical protein [Rhodospirillaceae bacterium]
MRMLLAMIGACAGVAGLGAGAAAQVGGETGNNYVAAQFISSESSCKGFDEGVRPLGLTGTCDKRDEGFRVAYGRYFTDNFGAELGYQDAGEGSAVGRLPNGTVAVSLKAPLKAVDLVGTARVEAEGGFVAMIRVGGAWWDYKVRSTPAGLSADNDKITLTYGLGLEWRWFTLGYDVITNVGQGNLLAPTAPDIIQDVKRISAGLKYRF